MKFDLQNRFKTASIQILTFINSDKKCWVQISHVYCLVRNFRLITCTSHTSITISLYSLKAYALLTTVHWHNLKSMVFTYEPEATVFLAQMQCPADVSEVWEQSELKWGPGLCSKLIPLVSVDHLAVKDGEMVMTSGTGSRATFGYADL